MFFLGFLNVFKYHNYSVCGFVKVTSNYQCIVLSLKEILKNHAFFRQCFLAFRTLSLCRLHGVKSATVSINNNLHHSVAKFSN